MNYMDWDNYFVINPKDSRLEIFVVIYNGSMSI